MFEIVVTDSESRTQFIEIQLTAEALATAMACRLVDCTFETFGLHKLGTRREYKTEEVTLPERCYFREKDEPLVRAAIAAHEVDGWIGRDEDARNGHRRVAGKPNTFSVTFERWVPLDGEVTPHEVTHAK
jgi:hypothetical protein